MTCPICQHAKLSAINADLAKGLTSAVIAGRYHIAKKLIELHESHHSTPVGVMRASAVQRSSDEAIEASPDITENPWRQFCHGVDLTVQSIRLAQDDEQMQARMRDRLQEKLMEAFADENLGL